MNYSDILLNKFIFLNGKVPEQLYQDVWSLEFPNTGKKAGEVQFKIVDVEDSIRFRIIDYFRTFNIDNELMCEIEKFQFDVNCMQQGEWIPMHNEVSQLSSFEIILWLTKTSSFDGRNFVTNINGEVKEIKPQNGMVCFLDTTDPHTSHGVSELLTDTKIISITGGLGRINGFVNRNK